MLFVLMLSFPIFAETYFCTYQHAGENKKTAYKRDGIHFLDLYEDGTEIQIEIIKESNEFIHLYKSYIEFSIPNYFATVIDKKNKTFVMGALEYNNSSDIIQGTCIVSE